jgi:hypothetical protein
MSTQRREQHSVAKLEPRLPDLPTKNRQLMPQHQNLQLLRPLAPPQQHHQFQHAADDDV